MLRWAVSCGQWLLALVFVVGSVAGARAQEIEPREFLPLPAGTNLAIGYYIHGSDESYYTTGNNKVPHSNLEVNLGLARYVHYFNVGGMPAGVQAFQAFGSESGGQVGGQSLGSTFGAGNTALSAFIWPYANQAKSQYLIIVGFVYPPVGSYDKTQALNAAPAISGSFGWAGDIQIGWDNAIGSHFSYDLGVDTHFYGDTTGPLSAALPISIRTKHSNDFRTQLWLNWSWNPALTTSIGYEGIWGGNTYFDNPLLLGGVGHTNTGAAREQRLRAAVSMFFSPQFQLLLEGNHDVYRGGGFDQAWGLTLRGLYIFDPHSIAGAKAMRTMLNRRQTLLAAVAASLAGCAEQAKPVSDRGDMNAADLDFVTNAANIIQFDREECTFAQTQAQTPSVRALAAKLLADANAFDARLQPLAQEAGIQPPSNLRSDLRVRLSHMRLQHGLEFDKTFVDDQIATHEEIINRQAMMAQSTGMNPKITQLAMEGSTILKRNLADLQRLQRMMMTMPG